MRKLLMKTAAFLSAIMLLASFCACDEDKSESDTEKLQTDSAQSSLSTDLKDTDTYAQKETDTELLSDEQLLINYYEKDLTEKYGKADNDSSSETYKTCAGLAGKLIYDFDGDEKAEMLVARSLGENNTEFALEIYEAENNEVKQQAVLNDGGKTYNNTFASNDIFFVKNGDEPLICSKLYTSDDISAFSYRQSIYIYKYFHDGATVEYYSEYIQNEDGSLTVTQNGETVCEMNADGNFDSALEATNLKELSKLLKNSLSIYSLDDKIVEEKSLDEIALITYDGYKAGSENETLVCTRSETVENEDEPVIIKISGNDGMAE